MLTVPCWLRRFWETDNLFSCEERIKRKKNAERALVSIHLFISLSFPSLDLSLHIPHVLPYSFWPFIIFLCPTAFWLLFLLFCLPVVLLSSFLHHLHLLILYNRPLGILVSCSNHTQSSSLSALTCHLYLRSPKLAWMDTTWGMPWSYPMASEQFRWCDSSSLCGGDPVSQVKDFPVVPEREAIHGHVGLSMWPESGDHCITLEI